MNHYSNYICLGHHHCPWAHPEEKKINKCLYIKKVWTQKCLNIQDLHDQRVNKICCNIEAANKIEDSALSTKLSLFHDNKTNKVISAQLIVRDKKQMSRREVNLVLCRESDMQNMLNTLPALAAEMLLSTNEISTERLSLICLGKNCGCGLYLKYLKSKMHFNNGPKKKGSIHFPHRVFLFWMEYFTQLQKQKET